MLSFPVTVRSNDLKAACIWPLVKDDDGGAAHGSRVGYQTAHEEPRAAAPFKQKTTRTL